MAPSAVKAIRFSRNVVVVILFCILNEYSLMYPISERNTNGSAGGTNDNKFVSEDQ